MPDNSPSLAPPKIVLVHLSDIHFTKTDAGGVERINEDVRAELKRDVVAQVAKLGQAHGILVTGDVAYSGRPDEYQRAEEWLADLTKNVRCRDEDVWLIPGNHDVQREVLKSSRMLRDFQHALRRHTPVEGVDAIFDEYLSDHAGKTEIFSQFANYNQFARKRGCYFAADQLVWKKNILLNDRSSLRICGMNSAFASNSADDVDTAKLWLGSASCVLSRSDGVEFMLLCHHPPDWLRDADKVKEFMESRVRLQLFGHKHKQRVHKIETGGFQTIRIHAGAVNPEQDGSYRPRYNILVLHVKTDEAAKKRTLVVELYPRIWSTLGTKFVADTPDCEATKEFRLHELPLEWITPDALRGSPALPPLPEVVSSMPVSNPLKEAVSTDRSVILMDGTRRLIFRFLSLPYDQRMEVANELKLLEGSDGGIDDTELFKRLFRRAAERNQLPAFFEAVEKKYSTETPTENPFA